MEIIDLFIDREQIDMTSYTLTEAKIINGDEGERYWRLRWDTIEGKRQNHLEFTVSMDGIVSYSVAR
jgi:hypothetical protein